MEKQTYVSLVLETPAAAPEHIQRHYRNKLAMETDVADVRSDLEHGVKDFLLVDVRSEKAYEECHITGAVSLPAARINAESTAEFSKDRLIVVYCWGPACNGGTKGAARLAELGFQVKEMLGGIEYWRKEGGSVEGTLGKIAPLIG
ncbi:rhodanese-like domain-containing protein [Paenibacillus sp. M1]|uniref:Rhodanese-like domain-containing protein n=1 Tax=Paenibacillus haidiansis TaxID=1574488 RepID=A0ABU7VMX6_9BACL